MTQAQRASNLEYSDSPWWVMHHSSESKLGAFPIVCCVDDSGTRVAHLGRRGADMPKSGTSAPPALSPLYGDRLLNRFDAPHADFDVHARSEPIEN